MLKKISSWLEEKAFAAELKRQLQSDDWLRQTYICVNLYLNSADYAKNNLTSQIIQTQMEDGFRRAVAHTVGLQLLKISKSENRVIECRSWIVGIFGEYASLRALYTPSTNYASEVEQGVRHEANVGLYDEFEGYAPKIYNIYFPSKVYQGSVQNNEELRQLSVMYQFLIDIGNVARIGLNDTGDWFRVYFNLCVAHAEANLRPDHEYTAAVLSEERETFLRNLLAGVLVS